MNVITNDTHKTAVIDLRLSHVALCGEGANTRSDILLNKRKEKQEMNKFEELMKSLEAGHAETITAHIEEIGKANKTAMEALEAKIEELTKSMPAAPAVAEVPTEDLMKNVPESIKKHYEGLEAQIAEIQKARADELAEVRFAKCKALPVEEVTLREVLKAASPATYAILEAAAAAVVEKTHTPEGTPAVNAATPNDAYAALEKSANELRTANPEMTYEQAFAKTVELKPELYNAYVAQL